MKLNNLQVNTDCASTEPRGVYHKEGGWPRDVNPQDSDQTARYRKKIEKDEAYSHTVLHLGHVKFLTLIIGLLVTNNNQISVNDFFSF